MLLGVADTPVVSSSRLAGWWRWAAVLGPGLLLYLLPLPDLNTIQRHLLAIFAATIVALVAQPVPMGASVVVAMTLLALTGTLPPAKVLSGFGNITVWLIFTAFLFGRAFTVTGLGKRVGYLFVRRFARGPLSLGYSLAAADLVLAPFIPSDTARGGSVIFPVTRSVASALGSEPGPTAGRAGAYLILASFHTCYTASAMFLTSMAANPLIAEFALRVGHVELTWMRWFAGASVPGFLTLAIVPWLLCRLLKPELRDMAAARELARMELHEMGSFRGEEKWLVAILLAVMAGWVTSNWHGISNTFVALAGLSARLGRAGLVCPAAHDVGRAQRDRRHQAAVRQAVRLDGGVAVDAGAAGARGVVFLSALRVRQLDGAGHGAVSRIFGGGAGGRSSTSVGGAPAGVSLQPECRADPLWNRFGSHLLQRRLCAPGGVVAHRIPDLGGGRDCLDGDWTVLVEVDRILVINVLGFRGVTCMAGCRVSLWQASSALVPPCEIDRQPARDRPSGRGSVRGSSQTEPRL
jgi:di/tricarboxylate transporter